MLFPAFSGSHYGFELSFNLNGYFSFTTISDILKQKLFLGFFFQNPLHFHTDWLIFEGLAIKVNLNQIQKYFGFGLLGPKPIF
jgi:hypothetical protein